MRNYSRFWVDFFVGRAQSDDQPVRWPAPRLALSLDWMRVDAAIPSKEDTRNLTLAYKVIEPYGA
jgi:hypothetical protein